ncbi:unnamed protein product [Cylindrotheca closterium]|uniref:Uncharacterized protein n=1 Tax=Cylindrotheca closterium TaxID=2856 RepID=A0AAD2FM76_9STRA|nr:unnamed protein product [Cylindrotheca closterium]
MRASTIAATFIVAVISAKAQRVYVDDYEKRHTVSGKPKIVTFAHTAVSLFDYGLTTDQLIGTYGEYVIEKSDTDFNSPEQTYSIFYISCQTCDVVCTW